MEKPTIKAKKRLLLFLFCSMCGYLLLTGRLVFIELFRAEELQELAYEQQTRDRLITPKRGAILDRNGEGIALTETVNAVSVIPVQVKEKEKTAQFLAEMLDLEYDEVLEKIKQRVALVRIKTKVDTETAAAIRRANYAGVEVDEDVRRIYPYTSMAAQVIGFVGKDNQGIIGLEAKYDRLLEGERGKILTLTDSRGNEVDSEQERIPPVDGKNLVTTMDVVMQQYAEQTIAKAVETKGAKRGVLIILNPQNGEIYAMANYPSFDLNEPFTIQDEALAAKWDSFSEQEKNEYLNKMWRNTAINDTYEPGSTFKIVTSSAGLEEGAVTPESSFFCRGFYVAGDRQIKCWRYPRTHGAESFVEGVQNSCNPVFMEVGERLGAETFLEYMKKYPKDLSGGMKQRVSFARTLLSGADMLLLDEPFSALDYLTRVEMQEWLLEQWEHYHKTILFITHDVEEAVFLSKKIFVIQDRPFSSMEMVEVPLPAHRDRNDLKKPEIVDLKERLIGKLRRSVRL